MSCNQVLLGIKDNAITPTETTDWKTNKIGGEPDWMPNVCVDNNPQCQLCKRRMALVVQVYCPLGTSPYDRTLYIFCCINQSCWNKQESWKACRLQQLPQEENTKDKTIIPTEEAWLSEELDWDDDNTCFDKNLDTSMCNVVAEQALTGNGTDTEPEFSANDCNPLTMRLLDMNRATTNSLPWQPSQTLTVSPDYSPVFKPYFINVIEEPPTEKVDSDEHIQKLLDSYQGKELHTEAQNMNTASGTETYEKYCIKNCDRTFQKFVKRVARCQEQVIRYSWQGEPLMIRKEETLPMACHYCRGPVTYELQLMPALVNILRLQNIKREDVAVEFGTVLIFTCQKRCWEDNTGYRIENVFFQSDPDEELFQHRM